MVFAVLILYFSVLLFISYLTGKSQVKITDSTFFKAGNSAPWFVVAFGMIGASISGITFVSVPGMARNIDMTYMQTVIGFFFGYIAVAHILLPLYYKLNLTSIYGYIGSRLGKSSYRTASVVFLLSRMAGTAAKVYLVCLILHSYLFSKYGIPFWGIAVGAVVLVWLYTHRSGLKTIVWTDTLQTFCLIAASVSIIVIISRQLGLDFAGMVNTVVENPHSRIFVFDDWMSRQNFFKQFFSGIFIVIVMTGLDQDMMQKNLSCRNLRDAQKNMYIYGFSFIPLNLLLLGLGILLLVLAEKTGTVLPEHGDDILPMFALDGLLGNAVTVLFTIGIIAATFSNADSALTAMTTSVCVDLLDTARHTEKDARRMRSMVHIGLAAFLAFFVCLVKLIDSQSVIDVVLMIASYTYGPLLGMFAFGLFTKRKAKDSLTPWIAVATPLLCFFTDLIVSRLYGYKFGYELLILNGGLAFLFLLAASGPQKSGSALYQTESA